MERFLEIGYLTEGPVSENVKYLCHSQQPTECNEIKPLDITTEQDELRWKLLKEKLREECWALPAEMKKKALEILYKFRFVFALKGEPWGLCEEMCHSIETYTEKPIKQRPRPVPPAHRQELETIINDLLARGLIEEANGPFASPICLVKKADGSLRCV